MSPSGPVIEAGPLVPHTLEAGRRTAPHCQQKLGHQTSAWKGLIRKQLTRMSLGMKYFATTTYITVESLVTQSLKGIILTGSSSMVQENSSFFLSSEVDF